MPVDFIIGAAVGAAVASESVRHAVRKGLVYSVGGALVAFDTVTSLGRRKGAAAPAAAENGTAAAPPQTSVPVTPVAAPSPSGTPS
jgi:hypothetical protein